MSHPGGQGSDPGEDPGVAASGGYEAPPIEQSPRYPVEAPSESAPIDYPPPGYYMNPPPTAPGPGYDATGYVDYPSPLVDYPELPPEHPATAPDFGPGAPGGYGPPPPGMYPPGYPPSYPVYPPGPAPATVPGTNGKAIASIVCGAASLLLCMCYLPALAAVVLGVIALAEINRSGQEGQGLAVGGIVLGGLSLLAGVVLTFTG